MAVVVGVFASGCPNQPPQPINDEAGARPPPRDFYHEARQRRLEKDARDTLRKIEQNTSKP